MPVAAAPGGLNDVQKILANATDDGTTVTVAGATWTNQNLPDTMLGGPNAPYSYNVMPLPQKSARQGYILKNFKYHETLKFQGNSDIALPASAPNRSPSGFQLPTAVFYDQQVFFADGPATNTVVHVENGAWLNLRSGSVQTGPYNQMMGAMLDNPNQQPHGMTMAKQISVPHGNSILGMGFFSPGPAGGAPVIPDAPSVLPTPLITGAPDLDTSPYMQTLNDNGNYQNPFPDFTLNPNKPLQEAVAALNPASYYSFSVNSANKGHTTNIPFEERDSDVTEYSADYWLMSKDLVNYDYLAYNQTIMMTFQVNGYSYKFPHVTTNVLTKVGSGGGGGGITPFPPPVDPFGKGGPHGHVGPL